MEEALLNLVRTYGTLGLFLVMIIQTIIAPIPSEALLLLAGGIGISMLDVVIYGGTGMIVGSIIAFWMARLGREALVKRFIGDKWLKPVDNWVNRHGAAAILVARLIPLIPFDLVSYVSGLTSLSFTKYIIATVAGGYLRTLMLGFTGRETSKTLKLLGLRYDQIILFLVLLSITIFLLDITNILDKFKEHILFSILKTKNEGES